MFPKNLSAIIFDFDGVFTDNKVLISEDGKEIVVCDRGDGLAINAFRRYYPQIKIAVISKEKNAVVKTRCTKLNIECMHGVDDKVQILQKWAKENNQKLENIIFLGNDLNDIAVMRTVGLGVAVNDAYPEVKDIGKLILDKKGGNGAIRELLEKVSYFLSKKSLCELWEH